MASTNLDTSGIQLKQIPDWSAGIITSKPATEIPDNAAQDILNMEFDDSNNLSGRAGIGELYSNTFASRITSLHYFTVETGEVGLLWTTGNKLYIGETDGTGVTEITGGLTLPSDNFWQWVTFGGLAIGVNKATTGDNPVKVSNTSTAAALGGSPPAGKYIAIWNNRVWIASADDPNTVWGSALNDPEDWSTVSNGGAEAAAFDIDPDDGDQITGLKATKDTLFVFKRRKIYRFAVINPSEVATDITNLKIEVYAQNVGCVSAYSIGSLVDDHVFLSEMGLASLRLSEAVEDFRTALFSLNVSEIQRTPKTTEDIPGLVLDSVTQYWLSVPASISITGQKQVFVLDYARVNEGIFRWMRFDGLAAGTAFTTWVDDQGKLFIIGAQNSNGDHKIYTYRPRDINRAFSDDGEAYIQQLVTKAYTMDIPLRRKHVHKWALSLGLWTDQASISVAYYLDGNESRGGTYSFLLTSGTAGARWNSASWDVSLWDSAIQVDQDIVRRLKSNQYGQRAQNITFVISTSQDSEAIVIKDFDIYWSFLTEKGVSEL